MEKLNIVLIAGTTRKNRQTIHAARMVENVAREFEEIEITFVDVTEFFPLPGEGNDEESKDSRWVEINKRSDAYFIVAPEYNHSFPGSLKMLLDNDLGNYTHKPVAVAGVSVGGFGGVRMIENLLPVLREIGMIATFRDVQFIKAREFFSNKDSVEFESQKERIRKSFKELIWMAKTLKWGRDNLT